MKRFLFLVLALAFITAFAFGSTNTYAKAEDEIVISFSNNNGVLPTLDGDVYVLDYSENTYLVATADFADDRHGISTMSIYEDGKFVEVSAITKAGEYDVRLSLSYVGRVQFRSFKLKINKKTIDNVEFEANPLTVEYGVTTDPQVYYDDDLIKEELEVSYEYYTDSSKTTKVEPNGVGTYYLVAKLNGENYEGSAECVLKIAKSNAEIKTQTEEITLDYSYDQAGENGYDLKELFGVNVENSPSGASYEIDAYYLKEDGGATYVKGDKINEVGYFTVYFAFSGDKDNFNYYESKRVTLVVQRAQVGILTLNALSYSYDEDTLPKDFVKKAYLDGKIYVVNLHDNSIVDSISFDKLSLVFYESKDNQIEYTPDNQVGTVYFKLFFDGNALYQKQESDVLSFEITKRDVSSEMYAVVDTFAFPYGQTPTFDGKYSIPEKYQESIVFEYFSVAEDKSIVQALTDLPSLPGRYALKITVTDNKNYEGSKVLYFIIQKQKISEKEMVFKGLSTVYGDGLAVTYALPSTYDIALSNYVVEYYLGDTLLENIPYLAGEYSIKVSLNDPIYSCTSTQTIIIDKKELKIKALAKTVVYGDDFYTLVQDKYPEDSVTITGLVDEADKDFVLKDLKIYVLANGKSYSSKTDALKVGVYDLDVRGESDNYVFVDDDSETLTIEKRQLRIIIKDLEQYVGSVVNPQITVANAAYDDAGSQGLASLFECYYTDRDGEELLPTAVGRYEIHARVKAEYSQDAFFDNYKLAISTAVLNVLDNNLATTLNGVTLKGNFNLDEPLTVREQNADKTLEQSVKAVASRYVPNRVYNIPFSVATTDNSAFSITFNYDVTADTKVFFGYNKEELTEVDFYFANGKLTVTQKDMPTYYVICEPKEVNVTMIILLVAAVVIAAGIFGVSLFIYRSGRNIKAKTRDEQLVATGIAPVKNFKSEDEELDELIENFDESTVERTEMPAERIAQKEKDELREQYRLRLRRMRSVSDKALESAILNAGINPDDTMFDEEAAIDMLIAKDQENKRIQEEADRKQREEQEKQAKESSTFTIQERKSGTLSGGATVSPKRNKEDDFDI